MPVTTINVIAKGDTLKYLLRDVVYPINGVSKTQHIKNKLLIDSFSNMVSSRYTSANDNIALGSLHHTIPKFNSDAKLSVSNVTMDVGFRPTSANTYGKMYATYWSGISNYGSSKVKVGDNVVIPFPLSALIHTLNNDDSLYNKSYGTHYGAWGSRNMLTTLPAGLVLDAEACVKLKIYFADPTPVNDFMIPITLDNAPPEFTYGSTDVNKYFVYPSNTSKAMESIIGSTDGTKLFKMLNDTVHTGNVNWNTPLNRDTYGYGARGTLTSMVVRPSSKNGGDNVVSITEVYDKTAEIVNEKGTTFFKTSVDDTNALGSNSEYVGRHGVTSPTGDGLFYLEYPYSTVGHELLADDYLYLTNKYGLGKIITTGGISVPGALPSQSVSMYNLYKAYLLTIVNNTYGTAALDFNSLPNVGRIYYTAKVYRFAFMDLVTANNSITTNTKGTQSHNYLVKGTERTASLLCGINKDVVNTPDAVIDVVTTYDVNIAEFEERFCDMVDGSKIPEYTMLESNLSYRLNSGMSSMISAAATSNIRKAIHTITYGYGGKVTITARDESVYTPATFYTIVDDSSAIFGGKDNSWLWDSTAKVNWSNNFEVDIGYFEWITPEQIKDSGIPFYLGVTRTYGPSIDSIVVRTVTPGGNLLEAISSKQLSSSITLEFYGILLNPGLKKGHTITCNGKVMTYRDDYLELSSTSVRFEGITYSNLGLSTYNKLTIISPKVFEYAYANSGVNTERYINNVTTSTQLELGCIPASKFKMVYDLGFPSRYTPLVLISPSNLDKINRLESIQYNGYYDFETVNNLSKTYDNTVTTFPFYGVKGKARIIDLPAAVYPGNVVNVQTIAVGDTGNEKKYIHLGRCKIFTTNTLVSSFSYDKPAKDNVVFTNDSPFTTEVTYNIGIKSLVNEATDWLVSRRLVMELSEYLLPSVYIPYANRYAENMVASEFIMTNMAAFIIPQDYIADCIIKDAYGGIGLKTTVPLLDKLFNYTDYEYKDIYSIINKVNILTGNVYSKLVIVNTITSYFNRLEVARNGLEVEMVNNIVTIEKMFASVAVNNFDNDTVFKRLLAAQDSIYAKYLELCSGYFPSKLVSSVVSSLKITNIKTTTSVVQPIIMPYVLKLKFEEVLSNTLARGKYTEITNEAIGASGIKKFLGYTETYNIFQYVNSNKSFVGYLDSNGMAIDINVGNDQFINLYKEFVISHEAAHTWQKLTVPNINRYYRFGSYDPILKSWFGGYTIVDGNSTAYLENGASARSLFMMLEAGVDGITYGDTLATAKFDINSRAKEYPTLNHSSTIAVTNPTIRGAYNMPVKLTLGKDNPKYGKLYFTNVTKDFNNYITENISRYYFEGNNVVPITSYTTMLTNSLSSLKELYTIEVKELRDIIISNLQEFSDNSSIDGFVIKRIK